MHMLQLNALRAQHCHTESPTTEPHIMGGHYVGQEASEYLYLATYHVLPTDQADEPSDIPISRR